MDENGNYLKNYSLPLGAHVVKDNGDVVKAGEVLVKIPRAVGKAGDITGGLPRVTELFELVTRLTLLSYLRSTER